MIIESKSTDCDKILPYTYMLYFNIDGKYMFYYGVRYGNVRLGISPIDDIFVSYFSSSKNVNNLLEKGIIPYKAKIHKTFPNYKEACTYEVEFLTRINAKYRKDFLNQTNNFDSSLSNNTGRILSDEQKRNMSESSKKFQSNIEYRSRRSDTMKSKWKDPFFIEKMNLANNSYVESGKSKETGIKSGNSRIGLKYSDDVKSKRSEVLKKVCEKLDMKSRAMNRKKYVCPICNLPNLDGGNFNRHMKANHEWNKEKSDEFKFMD